MADCVSGISNESKTLLLNSYDSSDGNENATCWVYFPVNWDWWNLPSDRQVLQGSEHCVENSIQQPTPTTDKNFSFSSPKGKSILCFTSRFTRTDLDFIVLYYTVKR